MIGNPFINEVLSKAIENYLKYKDKPEEPIFFSFPVQVIKTLVFIYGELDIINPYITHNEHNMGGFNSNLSKYGFPLEKVNHFNQLFLEFQKELQENQFPNLAVIQIQKYLIDMYFEKLHTMHKNGEDEEAFCSYLYLESNQNPYIIGDRNRFIKDPSELTKYYQSVSFEKKHEFALEELRRNTLIPDAYLLCGYNLAQIEALNDVDLRNVNAQIYQFFKVDASLPDRDEILQKAVNYYRKYGNRITSGNGYVDFLLFASIFATAIFVAVLMIFY